MIKNISSGFKAYLGKIDTYKKLLEDTFPRLNAVIDTYLSEIFKENNISLTHLNANDLLVHIQPDGTIGYSESAGNYLKINIYFYSQLVVEFRFTILKDRISIDSVEIIYFPNSVRETHLFLPQGGKPCTIPKNIQQFFKIREVTSPTSNVVDLKTYKLNKKLKKK